MEWAGRTPRWWRLNQARTHHFVGSFLQAKGRLTPDGMSFGVPQSILFKADEVIQ